MKIDIVYTWVDGSDIKWQEERNNWAKKLDLPLPEECRYRDNDELKYSLRSVEKYIPWVNKIFIVTNGQIPKWLDVNHSKIKIITHKDIMPSKVLPTYNSEAIETCLSEIPGLSEYFLYANDDCFINKHLKPTYFFSKNGKPIIRMVKQNWTTENMQRSLYINNIKYCINLIKEKFDKEYKLESSHNIVPYRKTYFRLCKLEYSEEYEKTIHYKFRTKNSVQQTLVSFFTIANNLGKLKIIKNKSGLFHIDHLYVGLTNSETIKRRLNRGKPNLFCINDGEYAQQNDRDDLKILLKNIFPKPAQWELLNKS